MPIPDNKALHRLIIKYYAIPSTKIKNPKRKSHPKSRVAWVAEFVPFRALRSFCWKFRKRIRLLLKFRNTNAPLGTRSPPPPIKVMEGRRGREVPPSRKNESCFRFLQISGFRASPASSEVVTRPMPINTRANATCLNIYHRFFFVFVSLSRCCLENV